MKKKMQFYFFKKQIWESILTCVVVCKMREERDCRCFEFGPVKGEF